MRVAIVDESSALVLHGNPAGGDDSATLSTTWAFLLLEQPDGTTRLLSHTRYYHADNLRSKLMGGPLLMEPLSFVMERKMLKVIKALVESHLGGLELIGDSPSSGDADENLPIFIVNGLKL